MNKISPEINSLVSALQKTTVHDHLCLLYEDKAEQFASAIPFIRIGLERGEKCIYINDENSAEEILSEMRNGGIDVDATLKNGSLSIISKREAYLRNGYFDPDEMIQFLKESTDQAKKDGFKALRATGEMTWMLGDEPGVERAMEYEAKLNNFFENNDCLALCQYNKKRFDPKLLIDVVRTHPLVISSNIVCNNFYYVPVDEFLKIKNGSRREFERFLQNLVERERIEQDRLNSLKFTESLDKINLAIQKSSSLKKMMSDVLDVMLSIFDCDRAWLLYPSKPDTTSFTVPMERTKPEWPGALAQGIEVPVDPEARLIFEATHASKYPVEFNSKSKPPMSSIITKNFQVKSQIAMNIYPKVGAPYMFGIHQCSYERFWTAAEKRLLQEIGRRFEDGLTAMLIYRDLQKSEVKYRQIVETAAEGIWVIDADQKTTFVNKHMSEMLGYSEKDMFGKKPEGFILPEDFANYTRHISELHQGKLGLYEHRFINKKGNIIWAKISSTPILDDQKKYVGSFAMVTDITKRKLAELEREQYFTFFQLSTDIMVIADPLGCFKHINPASTEILGYSETELLKKPFIDFVHPDDQQSTKDEMLKQIKSGASLNFENRYICKDGSIRWLSWRAKHNKIDGITYATARDITDQKQAVAELTRVHRALRMLSETNQTLIHVTDETILLNKIGEIIENIGGYRMMWIGFAEHDATKTVRPIVHAGFGADYIKNLHITWAEDEFGQGPTGLAIKTGKTQIIRDILTDPKMLPWREMAIKHGYRSSVSLPLTSNETTFGTLNLYVSETDAFSDPEITILEELASDLAFGIATIRMRGQTEKRLKEIDQLKNKFIQIVSHQLRTPLSVIRWNLEMLLERKRGELSAGQEEILRGTYAADIEIVSRIDDLMIALDIEESRLHLETEKLDVSEMFRSVCEEKLQASTLKKITHEVIQPETPLPPIEGDIAKISNVIARLIDNAIAYTPESGHIIVRYFAINEKIRFEITDNGIGIPDVEKPHIFERFHRGWNAALMRPDASGLGLFISKSYIDAHHGTIGFTSVEKKGSTFWFELPIANHNS